MSQSGYTPIQLYRTTTASATPSAGNLSAGELAINLTDEKLFFKNTGGTVKTLATSGTAAIGGSNTQIQYNNAGVLAGSSSFVFDGTNVGIGTSSPTSGAGYTSVSLRNSTGGNVDLGVSSTIYGQWIANSTSSRLLASNGAYQTFEVGGSERMRIDTSGNVGVGTTSISYKLEVGGDLRIAGGGGDLRIQSATGTTTALGDSVIYNDANDMVFSTGTTTAQRMRIDSSGNVIIAGGTPTVGGLNVAIGTQSTGQQVISSTTALGASHLGANLLVVTSGITLTLPTSAISGKTITIANASSGDITLSYTGSLGTDGPTTVAAGTSLQLISDGGAPPFWRLFIPSGGFDGTTLYAPGYKILPQNARTSSYTLALSDMGKHISITTGGVVIPANGSVAFPIGAAIAIYNNSGSNQTISITSDTLRQAGTANTGSRTLAQYGLCTVTKVASTTWVISGAGVS